MNYAKLNELKYFELIYYIVRPFLVQTGPLYFKIGQIYYKVGQTLLQSRATFHYYNEGQE